MDKRQNSAHAFFAYRWQIFQNITQITITYRENNFHRGMPPETGGNYCIQPNSLGNELEFSGCC
jgi:hypothetical protein